MSKHYDNLTNVLPMTNIVLNRAGKVLCPIDVVGDTVPVKVQVPGVKITTFSKLLQ